MGFETKAKDMKVTNVCEGILNCSLLTAFSSRALADAASYFEKSPLEIAEAFLIAKIRVLPSNVLEINAYRFESPEHNSRPPLETSETIIPFFLNRMVQGSILSVDTFARQINRIWNGISYQTSSSFSFSDFLFLWVIADFKAIENDKLEISSIRTCAISPNVLFSLLKIKSYPFDGDCFRHCLQTEFVNARFQNLNLIKSDGTQEKFRFGYFVLDPSGCLVPFLDGDEGIRSSLPAGVWCTEGTENGQKSVANLHVWLSILRYAFAPKGRRAFSISPVLAIHNSSSNSILFYSVRGDVDTNKTPRSLYLDFSSGNSTSPWYGFADRLYFHYFSGNENLKAKASRATSQIVVVRLSPLSSLRHSDQASLADYNKIFEAVSRLASNLGCRISKGLTSTVTSNSSSNKVSQTGSHTALYRDKQDNKKGNRSVKFKLPTTKGTLSAPENLPTRFEVPEASMLLEESHPERNQTNNSNNEIARLEALVEKLISTQMLHQTPTKQVQEEKTERRTSSVGTSTPIDLDVCSVAVNTSSIWPTPADIGLCKTDDTTIGNTGYSRLLAGIQQVLQQATPHLRKTVSVPGELSLLAQKPPRCTSAADNAGRMWRLSTNDIDADIEADVIRHRQDCEKEVAEKLDLTITFPPTELVECESAENHVSQIGCSGVSIPATTAMNSFTFATDFDPSVDLSHSRLRKGSSKSTDESTVLMGLARKYLSPSVIAQLAPSNSVTQDVSDFSLATRQYLKENGLTSSTNSGSVFGNILLDAERWYGDNMCSSSSSSCLMETSISPRLTALQGNKHCESFLHSPKVFSEDVVEKQNEANEEGNYDAPVLNLEQLRKLPKLL
ncbi:unnamed protein product [Rodentolepis nana]|uniref:RUN domain-containing protein n=1 Tax=Rodentolepis nana TaxID=102285 RepID=A0A0R3TLN3_RODNA|nr:unnamed protein product [Rodentolepis nana]